MTPTYFVELGEREREREREQTNRIDNPNVGVVEV